MQVLFFFLTLKNENRKAAFDIVGSYLNALLHSINNQTLKLADSREQFNANYSAYDGYWHNDKCYMEIKTGSVHSATTSHLLQNGVSLLADQYHYVRKPQNVSSIPFAVLG